MKASIYFSIILGIAFLTLRFVGIFLDLSSNGLFLGLGLFFLIGVSLPLYFVDQHLYKKKIKKIIEGHRSDERQVNHSNEKTSKEEPGLSKNSAQEYPSFRHKNQGLKWGGGNIHGSTATRGTKRRFLKK